VCECVTLQGGGGCDLHCATRQSDINYTGRQCWQISPAKEWPLLVVCEQASGCVGECMSPLPTILSGGSERVVRVSNERGSILFVCANWPRRPANYLSNATQ
jgi:hypothetical protein